MNLATNGSSSLASRLLVGDGLNYLNIGLMVLSMAAAYILPFEVFLFSYAVLGPLHYLTEISWLEKKNYFIKSRHDIWLFVLIACLLTYGLFDPESKVNTLLGSLYFSIFIYAFIILFVEKLLTKLALVSLTFVFSLAIGVNDYPTFLFSVFADWLPTLIHVLIFTGAFICYGALKTRSVSGMASLLVFMACTISFFVYTPANLPVYVSDYAKMAYESFASMNVSLYQLFGFGELDSTDATIFTDSNSIVVTRLIAFAYTYHYLNWFSKTTVIKWNEISISRMYVILSLWILSVALYAFDYKIGLYALFLLSLSHVFLEFPLNYLTFKGIGTELRSLVKMASRT